MSVFDEIFAIGCHRNGQNDNFRYSQWRKFRQTGIFDSMAAEPEMFFFRNGNGYGWSIRWGGAGAEG